MLLSCGSFSKSWTEALRVLYLQDQRITRGFWGLDCFLGALNVHWQPYKTTAACEDQWHLRRSFTESKSSFSLCMTFKRFKYITVRFRQCATIWQRDCVQWRRLVSSPKLPEKWIRNIPRAQCSCSSHEVLLSNRVPLASVQLWVGSMRAFKREGFPLPRSSFRIQEATGKWDESVDHSTYVNMSWRTLRDLASWLFPACVCVHSTEMHAVKCVSCISDEFHCHRVVILFSPVNSRPPATLLFKFQVSWCKQKN